MLSSLFISLIFLFFMFAKFILEDEILFTVNVTNSTSDMQKMHREIVFKQQEE